MRHHQVASRGEGLALREPVAYAAVDDPPGQVHLVCARVEHFDELLRVVVARGVVHDFVDDDGGRRRRPVRLARCAVGGIEAPRWITVRITALRHIGLLGTEHDPTLQGDSIGTGQK